MNIDSAFDPLFESRKRDHIRLALKDSSQAKGLTGLDQVRLKHEALPDLDFVEVTLESIVLNQNVQVPMYVNSMTAGHEQGDTLNHVIASACARQGWLMGVGSQRRQIFDPEATRTMRALKTRNPKTKFLGNLGISQLIEQGSDTVKKLIESIDAVGMIIHLNPLQECLQVEGTANFKGGLKAIQKLCRDVSVPVVVKETGCGFSKETVERLSDSGILALDVSGLGGTHWGRIEGARAQIDSHQARASVTLQNWGLGTVESLLSALETKPPFSVWASGGVRSGLDVAKLLSLGAKAVGLAQPIMAQATLGEEHLVKYMEQIEFELKTILFCTGSRRALDLQGKWTI
jgi:isopentenyl-diphosphate delta-isomerase